MSENVDDKHHSGRGLLVASLCVLGLLIALFWVSPGYRNFLETAWAVLTSGDSNRIEGWVSQFGFWGPVVIVFLMTAQIFLFVVPSWMLMVISVLAYGRVWGSVIAIVAVGVASTVGYLIGKWLGSRSLHKMLGDEKLAGLRRETDRYGIWAIVVARVNPFLSNDGVSIVGGVFHMPFVKFIAATMAGITPLAIAIAIFGREWERMKTGLFWLSIVSVIGLVAKIWLDRRNRKRES